MARQFGRGVSGPDLLASSLCGLARLAAFGDIAALVPSASASPVQASPVTGDLAGRRVGVRRLNLRFCVPGLWARALLQHDYGVNLNDSAVCRKKRMVTVDVPLRDEVRNQPASGSGDVEVVRSGESLQRSCWCGVFASLAARFLIDGKLLRPFLVPVRRLHPGFVAGPGLANLDPFGFSSTIQHHRQPPRSVRHAFESQLALSATARRDPRPRACGARSDLGSSGSGHPPVHACPEAWIYYGAGDRAPAETEAEAVLFPSCTPHGPMTTPLWPIVGGLVRVGGCFAEWRHDISPRAGRSL